METYSGALHILSKLHTLSNLCTSLNVLLSNNMYGCDDLQRPDCHQKYKNTKEICTLVPVGPPLYMLRTRRPPDNKLHICQFKVCALGT